MSALHSSAVSELSGWAAPSDSQRRLRNHFLDHLKGIRPASVKGNFVRKVCVASTMSPGVAVDVTF